ncbi:hypothetical protein BLA39750_02240 [Burkholderia lata]|uniref:Lipoprotein n=1 Tax=Burkholderia lata (strain ATCC 17760 / DSM 23089 / LMG 22485 / NCIMB 9086 / R18194 / 383) TaxID=482957 RepID=A0A6P2VXK6_BURL3|nr:hypothetical protein [Burkholderia lata]VWC96179.1 hypothetical protein BLA39750_02240 [Burkholderia lata]
MKRGFLLMAALLVAGCATKNYGRSPDLTSYEKDTMTCREIDMDLARTRGFVDHVQSESQFSGRDVLAFLGDFGIGNGLEKTAAMDSATKRMGDLQDLRARKGCGVATAAVKD